MTTPDLDLARHFLGASYATDEWVAVLCKATDTGRVRQHVAPVTQWQSPRWGLWLAAMQRHRFNVYVSVNALVPQTQRRTREAVQAVRHVFLDADDDGPITLARITHRSDLPPPTWVFHTSTRRAHVLWRVRGFTPDAVERLQRYLAQTLGTDLAATPCCQTTRLPGTLNLKHEPPVRVTLEVHDPDVVFTPDDFPRPPDDESVAPPRPAMPVGLARDQTPAVARARAYLARVPPAVSGQRGDAHTFRVCCRLARGFALSESDALAVLAPWNARCAPPWTERELVAKLRHAQRYGREPVGGLMHVPP